MLDKLYEAFIAHYLKDKKYKNTENAFLSEASSVIASGPTASAKKPESVPKNIKEVEGYSHLKKISTGKIFTEDTPDNFSATFIQLKEFIDQSLEEFKVFLRKCNKNSLICQMYYTQYLCICIYI